VFRLHEDQGVINRYGFNSEGHDAVQLNVRMFRAQYPERAVLKGDEQRSARSAEGPCVLGINLGKNKTSPSSIDDYSAGVRKFAALADYLVVNISSPNTPGLRDLQAKKELEELVSAVVKVRDQVCKESQLGRTVPLLVKIAPDLSEQNKKDIAEVVARHKVDGLVVTNTTVSRPKTLQSYDKIETGGLSGAPLRDLSTQVISDMYSLTNGQVPIIGAGGIASGQDALDKIKAGASVVQVYSALTYHGMPLVKRIQRELEILLAKEGYDHVSQAVGANHEKKVKRGFFF
jgi:dihydroorotate dehydrogenase